MDEKKNEIILFENQGVKLEVNLKDETVWLNRQQLAELFGRDIKTVIISVGYRVKSENGIVFRRWANKILKVFLIILLIMSMLVCLTGCGKKDDVVEVLKEEEEELSAQEVEANVERKAALVFMRFSISYISTGFFKDWLNDRTISIDTYLTKEMLNEELKANGYMLCTSNSTTTVPSDLESSIFDTIYFTEIDGEGVIYKVEIVKTGDFGAEILGDDIEVIE